VAYGPRLWNLLFPEDGEPQLDPFDKDPEGIQWGGGGGPIPDFGPGRMPGGDWSAMSSRRAFPWPERETWSSPGMYRAAGELGGSSVPFHGRASLQEMLGWPTWLQHFKLNRRLFEPRSPN